MGVHVLDGMKSFAELPRIFLRLGKVCVNQLGDISEVGRYHLKREIVVEVKPLFVRTMDERQTAFHHVRSRATALHSIPLPLMDFGFRISVESLRGNEVMGRYQESRKESDGKDKHEETTGESKQPTSAMRRHK